MNPFSHFQRNLTVTFFPESNFYKSNFLDLLQFSDWFNIYKRHKFAITKPATQLHDAKITVRCVIFSERMNINNSLSDNIPVIIGDTKNNILWRRLLCWYNEYSTRVWLSTFTSRNFVYFANMIWWCLGAKISLCARIALAVEIAVVVSIKNISPIGLACYHTIICFTQIN